MARSKAKVYACCALMLLCVVSVIVCIIVFTRVSPVKCPGDAFSHAAVAADSERCSQIGRDMLKRGGSAVDGAIAALLCTSIMNPQSMGIGGGSIFTVMDSSGNVKIINSRETVPKNFRSDLLQSCPETDQMTTGNVKIINSRETVPRNLSGDLLLLCPKTFQMTTGNVKIINSRETVPRNLSGDLLLLLCPKAFQMTTGSHWIGVPGEIRGYEKAHRMYGKLPWADLFQPTIKLAREGFPVPPVQGCFIPYIDSNATQKLRELFSDQSGNLLKAGDIVKFEKLADTLEVIAEKGADEFYSGRIAQDLISDIQEAGGTLTAEDLAEYAVTVTDAWAVPLGEYQMYIPPPPAGGTVLSFILNILKGYQLSPASLSGENKTLAYHRYIEAFKFANGLKKHIRDPKFVSEKLAKKFTTDSFADHIRSLIRDKTLDPKIYNIAPSVDGVGTTHLSVLAEDGSAVSVSSTINHIFGSKIFSPRTGIILNDELSDFCERVNQISPGERPPSSMAPTVLKSPSKTLVIGSSGGSRITTGLASALMNHLWFGKSLKEAIAAPVVFVDSNNTVNFEPRFDKNVTEALLALGHKQGTAKHFFNVVNAVEKQDGCICAVSDARKLGKPAGY